MSKIEKSDEDIAAIVQEYAKLGDTERATTKKSVDSLANWIVERFQVTLLKSYEILPDFLARLSTIVP